MQLLSSVSRLPENICEHCKRNYDNLLDHCIHDCDYLDRPRAHFFQEIYSLGPDIYTYLIMQDTQIQVNFLLGAKFPEFLQIQLIEQSLLKEFIFLIYTKCGVRGMSIKYVDFLSIS